MFSLICFGFYFQASLMVFLNLNSSIPSYMFRCLTVIISFFILINLPKKRSVFEIVFLLLYISLMLLYLLSIERGLMESYFDYKVDVNQVLFFLVFVVVVPSLSFVNFSNCNLDGFLKISSVMVGLTISFSVVSFLRDFDPSIITSGRISTEKINPISLGHLCVTLLVLNFGLYTCLTRNYKRNILLALSSLVSLGVLMATMSRGALLAFLLLVFYIIIVKGKVRILLFTMIFGICSLILMSVIANYFDFIDFDKIFGSYAKVGSSSDQSAQIRFSSYIGALNQFSENYLLGGVIEERSTGYYPHNIFLEILMSTGVLGGILYLMILVFTIFKVFMLKNDSYGLVISLLFLQYFVGSMFSGSVYNNNTFWYLLICILSFKLKKAVYISNFYYLIARREYND